MKDIHEILFDCHGAIKNITKITRKEYEDNSDGTFSYDEWQKLLKEQNIKDSFYINEESKSKMLNYLFYADFENGVYIPLMSPKFSKALINFQFNPDAMNSFQEAVKIGTKQQKEAKKNQKWEWFYFSIPETFSLLDFNVRAKEIDDDKLLEVFEQIYTKLDYNCNYIEKDIIKRLKNINNLNKKNSDNDEKIITIYRGQGEFSPNLDSVYSWTTNKKTAIKFALMRKTPKCLYKAKIKKKDIIAKFNSRNEKEIIALSEDIFDIKMIDFEETSREIAKDLAIYYLEEYQKYKGVFKDLKKKRILDLEEGVHSLSHSARVLFYMLMISDELKLNDREKEILAYCSIYHDIGRTNDDTDFIHGEIATKIIKNKKLNDFNLSNQEKQIADFIIKYHSINDEEGLKDLENNCKIINKKQANKLYKIFKDLDALDRVRFKGYDLDIGFFRFKEIKKKLFIASTLSNYGVESLILN